MWKSKSSVAVACFLPGQAKDLSAPLIVFGYVGANTCRFVMIIPPCVSETKPGWKRNWDESKFCHLKETVRCSYVNVFCKLDHMFHSMFYMVAVLEFWGSLSWQLWLWLASWTVCWILLLVMQNHFLCWYGTWMRGRDSSVGMSPRYGLEGQGIESR
jgi:hypothetical protein